MFAFREATISSATVDSKFKIVQFQANSYDTNNNSNDNDNNNTSNTNSAAAIQNGANINVRKNFSLTNFQHGLEKGD